MSHLVVPRQHTLKACGSERWQQLAYVEWGDPDNPRVVVCVHGLTRTGRDFDALARRLARDHRVVCPDVVGRGRSDWLARPEEYGYPRYVSDAALLLARIGVDQVDWVGTSMGGILGMLLAAVPGNPVRRLILNDVGSFIPRAALETIGSYVGAAPTFSSLQDAAGYLARVHAGFGALSPAQWETLAEQSTLEMADGGFRLRYDPAIAAAFKGSLTDVDLGAVWAAVTAPTLIVRGAESSLLSAQTVAAMCRVRPETESVTFPGCGHAPALLDPAQIAVLVDFLGRPG